MEVYPTKKNEVIIYYNYEVEPRDINYSKKKKDYEVEVVIKENKDGDCNEDIKDEQLPEDKIKMIVEILIKLAELASLSGVYYIDEVTTI